MLCTIAVFPINAFLGFILNPLFKFDREKLTQKLLLFFNLYFSYSISVNTTSILWEGNIYLKIFYSFTTFEENSCIK